VLITHGWLREFVPSAPGPRETAALLSGGGLAVASTRPYSTRISGVVVGEVRAVGKHPNADRLSPCTVDSGGVMHQVVCGAPNVRAGMKSPFAMVGARLPNGLTLAARPVRGVVSNGMLCSAVEVGMGADAAGILELPPDSATGEPFVPGPEDWVLDIEITPNRGDALSALGTARQLAALMGVPVAAPHAPPPLPGADGGAGGWKVSIEDPEGCGLYTALLLSGAKPGPSPEWMQNRLMACGLRPIGAIVDVTNYVLLETGHPLHAFDAGKVRGRSISVRRARAGESMKTLDGTDRKLSPEVLVIADAEGPVAAAGVMGGASSEITPSTSEVLLEAAWFEPRRVRRGARSLGLSSESSYRFERGVDFGGVVRASERAAALLAECAGMKPAGPLMTARGTLPERKAMVLVPSTLAGTLGVALPAGEAAELLRRTGCEVSAGSDGSLSAVAPTWRFDISQPADLVEEIAVLFGYDRIPSTMPVLRAFPVVASDREAGTGRVRDALRAAGFSEAMTMSLVSARDLSALFPGSDPRSAAPALLNAMSEDMQFLRTSLLPGLLRAAAFNLAREAGGAALFETGRTFSRGPAGNGLPEEADALAVAACGEAPADTHSPVRAYGFYDVKGALDAAVAALDLEPAWEAAPLPPYAPGQSAILKVGGRAVGSAGVLAPAAASAFDLPAGTAAGEVDLGSLLAPARARPPVSPPPRFPSVRRDLAVVVPEDCSSGRARDSIVRAAGPILEGVDLFDVYRGKQVPAGTKSLAFRLVFRSPERTLTEGEADEAFGRIVKALGAECGGSIRAS
jgi:phenylalanyl-tRNA synthetase beta chain